MKKLVSILLFFVLNAEAQISEGRYPLSLELELKSEIPIVEFSKPDLEELRKQDSLDALRNLPMRFGLAHPVNLNSGKNGIWENTETGSRIWRLALVCPEAFSINLTYKNFRLPEGGKFYVYNSKGDYILGAFTDENNKGGDEFATGLVPGEKIILEYNAPQNSPHPVIEIENVVHGYKNFFEFGDSGPCNNNVNCPEGLSWLDQTNSIAMIVLAGGTRWCSGAMINNACEDGSPYFLTANHCLTGAGVGNWMFYFNYQSPNCTNIDGPTNQIVTGATLLSTSTQSDFALLELDSRPPVIYNTYYSGWSNFNTPVDTTVSIHHPSGDIKKISFSYQPVQSTAYLQSTIDSNLTHWRIQSWDDGTTEGGSSGAPLFNKEKQIIGQLQGGYASCNNSLSDWYGKFSYSWDEGGSATDRLKDWLDPSNFGVDSIGGSYFNVIPSLEASIMKINSPLNNSCERIQIAEVTVKNKGIDTISTLQIFWEVPGFMSDTFSWTGNILPGNTKTIQLDTLILSTGSFDLNTEILLVNSSQDMNTCNNFKSSSFEIVEGNIVNFNIRSDNWPEELNMEIADTSGNVLFSQNSFRANAIDSFFYCLSPGCYDITLNDSWGDGLTGNGFYNIIYKDTVRFSGSGAFGNCTGSQMPNGCFVTHRICLDSTFFTQIPVAKFSVSDTLFGIGDTVFINDLSFNFPSGWTWTIESDSTNLNSTQKNISFITSTEGWYDVKLKVENIFGSDSLEIQNAFRVERSNRLEAHYTSQDFKIFPNPAKSVINIQCNADVALLEILSPTGFRIQSAEIKKGFNSIDISGLKSGMYLFWLTTESNREIQKILIQ